MSEFANEKNVCDSMRMSLSAIDPAAAAGLNACSEFAVEHGYNVADRKLLISFKIADNYTCWYQAIDYLAPQPPSTITIDLASDLPTKLSAEAKTKGTTV